MPQSQRFVIFAAFALLFAHAVSAETVARVGVAARDLGALDPAYGIGNGDEFGIRQIYNTLVSPPDGTTKIQANELQGELAETWEMSPDATHLDLPSATWRAVAQRVRRVHLGRCGVHHQADVGSEDRFAVFRQLPPDREHRDAGRLHRGLASQPAQSVHLRVLLHAALRRLRAEPQGGRAARRQDAAEPGRHRAVRVRRLRTEAEDRHARVRPVLGRQAEDRPAGGAVPDRDRRTHARVSSRATWT